MIAGVLVSSTMFATTNIGSNEIVRGVVDDALEDTVIDYQIFGFETTPSCATLISLADDVAAITNVRHTEVLSRLTLSTLSLDVYTGIETDSYAYNGITHISGATTLGVNETFMAISSTNISQYQLNDFVEFTFQVWLYPIVLNYTVSLEIVGFIEADTTALQILTGTPYWREYPQRNLFIMNFESTMCPIRETIIDVTGVSPFADEVDVFVEREAVISGVDIEGSLNRLATIRSQIANIVGFTAIVWSPIETALQLLSLSSMILFVSFIVMSAPIFFVALYMGITFSDVTFNLRRREVGLLLTKGFSRGSLLRMFILETIIIGILTGAAGILLAILIVPFFVGTSEGWQFVSLSSVGLDTIALCMIFSCVVTFISVYFSARRATQIPTVEALRHHRHVPQDKGYRKLLTWAALLIGVYKMIIWSTGFSVSEFVSQMPVTSFLLFMGLSMWVGFDQMVTPWAMMLFLYGLAKIVVHGTTILYRITGKVLRSGLGDIGELATRSIQRNPARTGAVIFILALVIGYSVQATAVLASDTDYTLRSTYMSVGADISAGISPTHNTSRVITRAENIAGIESVTAVYSSTMILPSSVAGFYFSSIDAIDPLQWFQTAYFEEAWFSLVPASQAIASLASDNYTIVLDYALARQLVIPLESSLTVNIGGNTTAIQLTVVGFIGPSRSTGVKQISLVPLPLLEQLGEINSSNSQLLAKTAQGADVSLITDELEGFSEIREAHSVIETLTEYSSSPVLNAQGNILRIGMAFTFVLASIGTVIVVTFTLKEKQRENALMAARGLTFRQTAQLLIAESTTWIIFAALIGVVSGFIAAYGAFQSLHEINLWLPRNLLIIISPQVFLFIGELILLLIICAVVPMLLAARRAQTCVDVLR